jgi:hypothetical protein
MASINGTKKSGSGPESQPTSAGLPTDAAGLLEHFQKYFKQINRGHHKNMHAFINGAAKTIAAYRVEPFPYAMMRTDSFWGNKKVPKKVSSRHIVIRLMEAKGSTENRAGKYARVADYLLKKGIDDGESFLNQHGIDNVLKKASVEFPSTRNTRKGQKAHRLTLSVRNSDIERIRRVQENCDVPVGFLLRCEMAPRGKGGISGRIKLGIEPMTDTTLSSKEHQAHVSALAQSLKVETKLAGGITPYVEVQKNGWRFITGLRGDPLTDISEIPSLPRAPRTGNASLKSRSRGKAGA